MGHGVKFKAPNALMHGLTSYLLFLFFTFLLYIMYRF